MHDDQSEAIEVLLVEDDPGDVLMTREAFEQQHKLRNTLHVVSDGVEALSFLRQEGEYADVPRPDLVLLDLNLHARTVARSWPRSRPIRSCAVRRWSS